MPDATLETVANRSVPLECGPNVDQAGRPRPNGLRSDARIEGTSLLTTAGGVQGMYPSGHLQAVSGGGWPSRLATCRKIEPTGT